MLVRSVRFKLTLMYVLTVALLLAVFIGMDMIGLYRNLDYQAGAHAISPDAMEAAWARAIWEHLLLAINLVLIVFVFGYLFIRHALHPVREITRTAKRISEQDLSLRVDGHGDKAEVGELADTLNAMIARLEASFERVKRFSADAAHELSTPLTVLRGEIEVTLRRERDTQAYKDTLNALLQQVQRLSAIVDNLLFLSRSDACHLPSLNHAVKFDDLVVMASENLQQMASVRDIRLDLQTIDAVRVAGDSQLLLRMLTNLLSNAIKFSHAGDRVGLALHSDGARFRLQIRDTGSGIPADDLPHIFDRFYRVEKSRAQTTGGAGLGLAIVREIVDAHGFDIDIQSEAGGGTRVTVSGPQAQS